MKWLDLLGSSVNFDLGDGVLSIVYDVEELGGREISSQCFVKDPFQMLKAGCSRPLLSAGEKTPKRL